MFYVFFFSSRRRHTRWPRDWSSDVCSSDLKENVLFSNVGDSRAYIYFNNQIELVTEDHSFVSELQRKGALTDLEALNHYNRNALTRSLGVEGPVDVDFFKRLRSEERRVGKECSML